jgi:class 3 adenylate cyclase/HAMP domain-containing protein
MLERLGLRGRLLLAFLGISAFAVLGSAAAIYSFVEVGKVLERIIQRRVPSTLASLELSRQVERVVAVAPTLLTVTTSTQYEEVSARIASDMEHLGTSLNDLKGASIEGAVLQPIDSAVEQLRTNFEALDKLVVRRLIAADRKKELLRQFADAYRAVQRLVDPMILVAESDSLRLRRMIDDPNLTGDARLATITKLADTLASDWPQQVQFQVSAIVSTVLEAADAPNPERLPVLAFPLHRSLDALNELVPHFKPDLQPRLLAQIGLLSSFIEGSNSILDARNAELAILSEGQQRLSENNELSRRLTKAVDQLVSGAKQDILNANREALSAQQFSTGVLIALVAMSLISSVLIVWLYVDRSLIARLTALSRSMLAIADGNLDTSLPATGADEIGRMAKALAIFRDTAVEVKKNNLREIAEARRRLIAAIESISEGFSLYDADDRLVICNSNYTRIMYPGIEDAVTPGMSFETVIRRAVERGLVGDAEGRVEEWVAERLARHRGPGGSHLQRRGDRWVLINERKTEDGSTVAVYADITELKQRENQLADKSRALEQLSNQLAKYLSPQVYDSIFSGKQEVKIASRRKKLTVFFSDIAGFTETTERLESEDLTRLLNHYITEMSQIALFYGATIDKYVGDAIVIFFGDPESRGVKEDALACVEMAIAMRKKMRELQDVWRASGIEKPLQCRIGINTGYCTVGNFGSEARMDYTIIGAGVNLASRLEAAATPGEILLSYETYANVRDRIHCEERGQISVKGIAYPVATYQVVDSYENLGAERLFIHEERPNVRLDLDLDLDAMSADDRGHAVVVLREALNRLLEIERATTSQTQEPKQSLASRTAVPEAG